MSNHGRSLSEFRWPGKRSLSVAVVTLATAVLAHGEPPQNIERLHDACRRSDLETVRTELREFTGDINARAGEPGRSALHLAVQGRSSKKEARSQIVIELLERGADVNAVSAARESVLQAAVQPGWDERLIELLLTHGAKIDADPAPPGYYEHRGAPLHRAAARGDLKLATFLLDHGADPNSRHELWGTTPLMFVFGNPGGSTSHGFLAEIRRTAAFAVMRLLLDRGADLRLTNKKGETALHWAAGANHLQGIRELLSRGADASARTQSGRTVLHFAASNDHYHEPEVINSLLAVSRLSINVTDHAGDTPLHAAVGSSCNRGVQTLLLLGARTSAKNAAGLRPGEAGGVTLLDQPTREMLRRYAPPPELMPRDPASPPLPPPVEV